MYALQPTLAVTNPSTSLLLLHPKTPQVNHWQSQSVLLSIQLISTAGLDYDARTQIIEIPASPQPGEMCFSIAIVDDNDVETTEEFLVNFQISAGSDAQIGTVGSTCIQIIDDDEGT